VVGLLTPSDVFHLHPKIRWAAFSADGSVVFSEMRSGVESLTEESEDKAFMELGPLFMTSIAERLTPGGKAGRLESVIACFEKDCVMLVGVKGGHLAFSVDTVDAFSVFQDILPGLAKLREV